MEIAAPPALQAVIRGPFVAPASDSDGDLMAFVRRSSQTLYHPTSTLPSDRSWTRGSGCTASTGCASPTCR